MVSSDDDDLWQTFTKTVKKQTNRSRHIGEGPKPKPKVNYDLPISTPAVGQSYFLVQLSPKELRQIAIDASIDLHGFTSEQAEQKLILFIQKAQQRGCRWVCIITGKGTVERPSVLKKMLPQVLETMAHLVVGFSKAKQHHGGDGAFYVKIRRLRPK